MEFISLIDLEAYITETYTANGGSDEQLISASELLKGVKGLKEFIQQRGVKVANTTGDIAYISGNETSLVIVKNKGIFVYDPEEEADGVTSFAASNGGAYVIASRFPPKTVAFAINLDQPAAIVIPADYSINKILFSAAENNNVNIGITENGTEVEEAIPIEAAIAYPYTKPLWWLTDTTLYFSAATSQVNIKIIFD